MSKNSAKTAVHLNDLAHFLRDVPCFWAVGGGWAIDLFLGRETRPHGDIDIIIWREDQHAFRQALPPGKWQYINSGWSATWKDDHFLHPPLYELNYENDNAPPFEVLLDSRTDTHFSYRRDHRIERCIHSAILNNGKMNYLAPELALLYKSGNLSEKDHGDFQNCLDHLPSDRKNWLKTALTSVNTDHGWLKKI